MATDILRKCLLKFNHYALSPRLYRVEQKHLQPLISFLEPCTPPTTLEIFRHGIQNDYHSGNQLQPLENYSSNIIQEAFMANCVLNDFEAGYLLGPFPKNTRFIITPDNPLTTPLRFVNIFTVPKTKRNQKVGRAVFDIKKSGYNLGIPDEDAYVRLPQFNDVVNLLRHKKYACILDLRNAYRQ